MFEVDLEKATQEEIEEAKIQGRKIGNRCIIGAGEVIRKNILNED